MRADSRQALTSGVEMLVETRRCGRLWVDVRGEGPPVVLWHSVLCDGSMWSTLPASLARTHRVINVDGPGHGRSSPVRAPYTMEDCVDSAIAVLDACGVERAIWCGLSWGGMVGLRVALRSPQRIAALVLVDSNADEEVREKLHAYRVLASITRLLGPIPPILDRIEPIFFSPHTLRANRAIVDDFRRRVAAMDRESIRHVIDAVILDRDDIRAKLERIEAPTLVVFGADDVATPRQRSEDIASRISGAHLVEIPRAGHLSAWEQPDAVREVIELFLATLER